MSDTIHIANGDATRELLEQAGLPGRIVTFQEAMSDGPVQKLDSDDFVALRARFLAREHSQNPAEVRETLLMQEQAIEDSRRAAHVVIWVEHDLFCSIHLWYLLSRYSADPPALLELVSVGHVESRPDFRGLGELSAAELAALYPRRIAVTAEQLAAAESLWNAFTADDPEFLLQCEAIASSIPFAIESIRAQASRFPSRAAGLGAIEFEALRILKEAGPTSFPKFFRVLQSRVARFGFGDTQVLSLLRLLGEGETPLTRIHEADGEIVVEATSEAAEILRGTRRAARELYHDRWLGGVRLDSSAMWYWNEERSSFERS